MFRNRSFTLRSDVWLFCTSRPLSICISQLEINNINAENDIEKVCKKNVDTQWEMNHWFINGPTLGVDETNTGARIEIRTLEFLHLICSKVAFSNF